MINPLTLEGSQTPGRVARRTKPVYGARPRTGAFLPPSSGQASCSGAGHGDALSTATLVAAASLCGGEGHGNTYIFAPGTKLGIHENTNFAAGTP